MARNKSCKKKEKRRTSGKISFPDGTYDGETTGGKRHGQGICKYSSGAVYEGAWEDDSPGGYGCKSFPTGDRHEGYYFEGRRHGWGFYLWVCGDKYSGDWQSGAMHGNGCFSWSNGDVYMGCWQKGKMQGRGSKTCADGSSLKGQFSNGHLHGHGIKLFAGGDRYSGDFVKGSRHGFGRYLWSTGDVYAGQWASDRMSGTGHMKLGESARARAGPREVLEYTGQFKDGERHGQGEGSFRNGVVYSGEWSNDEPHGWGTMVYPGGDEYCGCFCHGLKQGEGVFWFQHNYSQLLDHSGDHGEGEDSTYRGQWWGDVPHGEGVMEYTSGHKYHGDFRRGLREGQGQLLAVQRVRGREIAMEKAEGADDFAMTLPLPLQEDRADLEGDPSTCSLSAAVDGYVIYYEDVVNGEWREDGIIHGS